MQLDRHRLHRQLRELRQRKSAGKPFASGLERLLQELQRSQQLLNRRREQCPMPTFQDELPISARRDEIAAAIAQHQVIILCGETGSGKSTQLPKICLSLGRGIAGRIGHTQPRRIAARSLMDRISSELGREPGSAVGYKVRFKDHVRPETHIKLMTDGILLAEIQQDRYLNEYDTLIIDEAHERTLNIDFLLGYLKQLLPKRPDLKVIITSATIDPESFSRHFNQAPVIEVSGRTYPVELRYHPLAEGSSERDDPMQQAIMDAVDELSTADRGDILIFLSGEREIRETAESLRKHRMLQTEVLPLYARLSAAEQTRIFKPHAGRRIILSTNVAETSLTVPGIRYVIDPGFARISRYSHRSKVQRLPVERISQASANQRKGRCGRVSKGICIRLYSEEDFQARREFIEPEIQRTNLAAVILQMKTLGFGEVEQFPFIEPPDSRLIKDGYRLLEELGAVGGDRRMTRLGRELAALPVDPRIGRMLLAAARGSALREVVVIAAALSVQDPRERPMEQRQAADEVHREFQDERSDFIGFLTLWRYLEEQRRHLSRSKFRKLCKQRFLSWNRVQEWHDVHHQLSGQLHEMGFRDNQAEASYESIHQALLTGLLSNIGFRDKDKEYLGARGSRFWIFPGSSLFKSSPKWLMAAERVETTKQYARTVAQIQPAWVEAVAGHLIKRSYSEPHWEKRSAQVAAYERTTLYGITLNPRRKINFGPISPDESREIFIRSALVDGDYRTRAPFFRHNQELIAHIWHLESKARRQDILVDHEVIYAFYDARIPAGIYSGADFEKWLKGVSGSQPKLLHMTEAALMQRTAEEVTDELYPDVLNMEGILLPLEYHFKPGEEADGIVLKIPLAVINQISEARCEWLVPGLLREKIIALLRGLPKPLRKSFVPVPDYADACLKTLQPSDKPLTQQLGEELKRMTGVHIPEDAWQQQEIPQHLRMGYQLVNDQGHSIATGQDLLQLKEAYGSAAEQSFKSLPLSGLERDDLKDWDFGDLPESVPLERGEIKMQGYPALVARKNQVAIRVLDSKPKADQAMKAGLRALIMLKLAQEIRYLRRNLPELRTMQLQYAKVAAAPEGLLLDPPKDLETELVSLIVERTFIEGHPPIRTEAQFAQRISTEKNRLVVVANESCQLVSRILGEYQQARKMLSGNMPINLIPMISDMQQQLERLIFRGVLQHTAWQNLQHFPRYLKAIVMRWEKLGHAAGRDLQQMRAMQPLYSQWWEKDQATCKAGKPDARVEELRWSFEELRVSLFAQELRTAAPISLKRIEKRWKELGL
ncbi:MAG: ATP-dependent RNA helicase HrpA [Candidatus Polarisedimenticolaceae bacterium]|nr:ATP-dependent RNA helicase HrpA [Candidatus Polarisedimenticolaceae bacterium]